MQIKFGTLLKFRSSVVTYGLVGFVVADVDAGGNGWNFDASQYLKDYMRSQDVQRLEVWVPARIKYIFGLRCTERELFDLKIVAILNGEEGELGIPFVFQCGGFDKLGLVFTNPGPVSEIQSVIAQAFWDLLISEPNCCADYRDEIP